MGTKRSRYPLDKNFLETKGFRPEIQGLRALAVLLVVLYHVWFGRVSGGVDVFLFISAFLLSLSSVRKINEGKPLSIVKYWIHVFQRLMPLASVVILLTTAASYFVLAPSRWLGIIQDALATLFYYLNWHLAFGAVDYYAQDAASKTPFQHFWSLSMQGQIFIIWPLLFCLVSFLARKLRFNLMASAALIFGMVWSASLTFSVLETYSNQGFAYFDTRTRLWEFASGTLLAMLTFKWSAPLKTRIVLGWIGILGLVTCGFLLPVEQAFPGYLALWPILSGAMVIFAGRTESPYGVDRILTAKPLLMLGESSYALYLVHWPILTLYATWSGKEHVNYVEGTIIIVSSIVLAVVLHKTVEAPIRKIGTKKYKSHRAKRKIIVPKLSTNWIIPVATVVVCLLAVSTPLNVARAWIIQRDIKMADLSNTAAGTDEFPGALSIGEKNKNYVYPAIPISGKYNVIGGTTCTDAGVELVSNDLQNSEIENYCWYNDFSEGKDEHPIIVMGDSHSHHSIPYYMRLIQK